MSARGIYKGYTFADVSTPTEGGQYRARVAIMALDGTRTRSQRFLDLEIFPEPRPRPRERVLTVARAWIDANAGRDLKLAARRTTFRRSTERLRVNDLSLLERAPRVPCRQSTVRRIISGETRSVNTAGGRRWNCDSSDISSVRWSLAAWDGPQAVWA